MIHAPQNSNSFPILPSKVIKNPLISGGAGIVTTSAVAAGCFLGIRG